MIAEDDRSGRVKMIKIVTAGKERIAGSELRRDGSRQAAVKDCLCL